MPALMYTGTVSNVLKRTASERDRQREKNERYGERRSAAGGCDRTHRHARVNSQKYEKNREEKKAIVQGRKKKDRAREKETERNRTKRTSCKEWL